MKITRLTLGLIVTAGAWLAAAPAQAQTFDPSYPVCMHVYTGASGGGGEWYDCSFTSLPQCRATAAGQAATCVLNPYYGGNVGLPRPYRKRSAH
jgi:hypothetical protein